ncbi:MAG: hypothetical protein KDA68_06500 [Planctomycetaceae bacterium]|nr:hypothetical protein [Planctomycetaceae bacterium]
MSAGPEATPAPATEVVAKPKSGKKKLIVIAVIVLIVLAQLAVVYYFLLAPSGKTEEKKPETELIATAGESALGDLVEVNIGTDFNCTNGKAHEGAVIHVNFKVVALVNKNEEVNFKDAVKAADARIKEAVMIVARQADTEALNDPNLGSIKRLIREQINKILKKSYIREIVISEYSLIER